MGGESPSKLLAKFVARVSYLYVLPPAVALELLRLLCAFVCAMQSILTVCAIYYWRRPITLSASQAGATSSAAAPAAANNADTSGDVAAAATVVQDAKKSE